MIKGIFMSEEEYKNALKNVRADERRKFAEWLIEFSQPRDITIVSDLGFIKENGVETYKPKVYSVDEILAEYEKESD